MRIGRRYLKTCNDITIGGERIHILAEVASTIQRHDITNIKVRRPRNSYRWNKAVAIIGDANSSTIHYKINGRDIKIPMCIDGLTQVFGFPPAIIYFK